MNEKKIRLKILEKRVYQIEKYLIDKAKYETTEKPTALEELKKAVEIFIGGLGVCGWTPDDGRSNKCSKPLCNYCKMVQALERCEDE
jgi:hypothetical protein